jgi:hypothetical protein
MITGEATPRSVAERWTRGARALHKADRVYARQLVRVLEAGSQKDESPLPGDPLEEAMLVLFSEVAKRIMENRKV